MALGEVQTICSQTLSLFPILIRDHPLDLRWTNILVFNGLLAKNIIIFLLDKKAHDEQTSPRNSFRICTGVLSPRINGEPDHERPFPIEFHSIVGQIYKRWCLLLPCAISNTG